MRTRHPLCPGIVLLAALITPPGISAQEITAEDAQRVAPYYRYWELADAAEPLSADVESRLSAAIREAEQEFRGRGPALARYFLRHVQATPGNTAFFFLFRAIGDVETARVLIPALLDPPPVGGQSYGRDAFEVGIGIEALLKNSSVASDPAATVELSGTLTRARQQPGGDRVATIVVSLLGACRSPEATRLLEALTIDPDSSIRSAAVTALGASAAPSAAIALRQALTRDADPEARARAAESLVRHGSPDAIGALEASLSRETNPRVIDTLVRALVTLGASPTERQACLDMASRCWEASVAEPLFACWRAGASRDDLIRLATSGGWTTRVLALRTLAGAPAAQIEAREPRLVTPDSRGAAVLARRPVPDPPSPGFEPEVRDRLLQSGVEILSQRVSGIPLQGTLSYSTAQLARDAFWQISGGNMAVALEFADRILPVSGRHTSIGRFGESVDLASRDRASYVRARRPQQLFATAAAALALSPLLALARFRRPALALILALGLWAAWFSSRDSAHELPPIRLAFLTVSCLAFLGAGLAAGGLTLLPMPRWLRVISAPIVAGVAAFVLCAVPRWVGWFPTGSEGWELIFDPLASAILAVPAALLLSLTLEVLWPTPRHVGSAAAAH